MEKEELKSLQKEITSLRAEGKYKETIEAGFQLLQYGSEFRDSKSILIAYLNMAASYYCIGDIGEAFHYIDAYAEVCSQFGDESDFLNLYNVRFLLYEYNKDYKRAKETLQSSIQLGRKLGKYNIISNGYSNGSHVYMKEKNYPAALNAAKMGLKMAKLHKPASAILELRVTLNMAQAYIELNELEEADKLIQQIGKDPILDSFIREKSQFHILLASWFPRGNFIKRPLHPYLVPRN